MAAVRRACALFLAIGEVDLVTVGDGGPGVGGGSELDDGLAVAEQLQADAYLLAHGAAAPDTGVQQEPDTGGEREEEEEEAPATVEECVFKRKGCVRFPRSAINERTVLPFKGRHAGHTGVLLGTGRSLDQYKHHDYDRDGKRIYTFGVKSIIWTEVPMDYVLVSDKNGPKGYAKNRKKYDTFQCREQKFYARFRKKSFFGPDDKTIDQANATFFEVLQPTLAPLPLVKDVGHYVFGSSRSSIFLALQFALYTGVTRLFVVGCDAEATGYSRRYGSVPGTKPSEVTKIKAAWGEAQMWVARNYPDVEVVLVNPVGLRNMRGWKKMYGKSAVGEGRGDLIS